jgi:hypothetical protein
MSLSRNCFKTLKPKMNCSSQTLTSLKILTIFSMWRSLMWR